jgi:phospholipase C
MTSKCKGFAEGYFHGKYHSQFNIDPYKKGGVVYIVVLITLEMSKLLFKNRGIFIPRIVKNKIVVK